MSEILRSPETGLATAPRRVEVFKLGGSLFDLPALPSAVRALIRPTHAALVVPGGGAFVEAVRSLSPYLTAARGQVEAEEHRLALLATRLSAAWVAELLDLPLLSGWLPVADLPAAGVVSAADASDGGFPHDWSVTSDSLSAVIARKIGAERLTLLKSAGPFESLEVAVDAGALDHHFPATAAGLDVRWVNVRAT